MGPIDDHLEKGSPGLRGVTEKELAAEEPARGEDKRHEAEMPEGRII